MVNKYISDNIDAAKNYVNSIEEMGIVALKIADRILDSNKLFVHAPEHQKTIDKELEEILKGYNDSKNNAITENEKEPESYEKHIKLANFFIKIDLEKTQKLISFWDRLNQKL